MERLSNLSMLQNWKIRKLKSKPRCPDAKIMALNLSNGNYPRFNSKFTKSVIILYAIAKRSDRKAGNFLSRSPYLSGLASTQIWTFLQVQILSPEYCESDEVVEIDSKKVTRFIIQKCGIDMVSRKVTFS